MPTTEWLNKYEAIKDKLTCKDDLEAHFTEKVIGNMAVDVLDIGAVHFPTGQIFACDPLVELEDTLPFLQTIPAGTYPVKICVVPSEQYGDRYACVKVEVSQEKPVRYELGMVGNEDLDEELGIDLTSETSETIGGFLIDMLGEIPDENDVGRIIEFENYQFKIMAIQDRRIERVKIYILDPAEREAEDSKDSTPAEDARA